MAQKIKFKKQFKPMGFGDRDDRGSVEAHLRAKEHAKEMRNFNKRMKEFEAEDARRRDGIISRAMAFFSSKHGTR
ncbi:hypothetical protein [Tunturiibacter gelidoferens]|uniref:Uncharacterized protein n=1 Tax=Tunturiibacter gelidiferens TaxID=3069689 RepID=A0A9X0QFR6_9BACT|nr:hypothetical protein [Edaphobacter lichenicola]MBB5329415.1 hypothetical protein [Edaphobacter lichenicola]